MFKKIICTFLILPNAIHAFSPYGHHVVRLQSTKQSHNLQYLEQYHHRSLSQSSLKSVGVKESTSSELIGDDSAAFSFQEQVGFKSDH